MHSLDFTKEAADAARSRTSLSFAERTRAAKFLRAGDRARYVAAHVFVRTILGSYLDCLPVAVPLRASPTGRPLIDAGSELRYSLAHCARHAVVAVSFSTPVGIDIECARPVPNALAIAERYFAREEVQTLRSARAEDRNGIFLRLWTSKEAFAKAIGLGLGYEFHRFSVAACDTIAPYFGAIEAPYGPPSAWSLRVEHRSNACIVAVAVRAVNAAIVAFGPDETVGNAPAANGAGVMRFHANGKPT